MITKNDIITAFKNSCILLGAKAVIKRSISVKYQNQRNIWEVYNHWFGVIRIENRITDCSIELFPLLNNTFGLKENVVFEITKDEYDELCKLYFGKFKEDKKYFKRINKMHSKPAWL